MGSTDDDISVSVWPTGMRKHTILIIEIIRFAWATSVSQANGWATIVGAVALCGLAYLGRVKDVDFSPGLLGNLQIVASCLGITWILIFVGRLAYAPIALLIARDRKISDIEMKINKDSQSLHLARISIEIGSDEDFVKTTTNEVFERQDLFIAVANIGQGRISNIRLYLEKIDPNYNGAGATLLSLDSFTLTEGERKFVQIAYYNRRPESPVFGIAIPLPQGYDAKPMTLSTNNQYELTLKTTSYEIPEHTETFAIGVIRQFNEIFIQRPYFQQA